MVLKFLTREGQKQHVPLRILPVIHKRRQVLDNGHVRECRQSATELYVHRTLNSPKVEVLEIVQAGELRDRLILLNDQLLYVRKCDVPLL